MGHAQKTFIKIYYHYQPLMWTIFDTSQKFFNGSEKNIKFKNWNLITATLSNLVIVQQDATYSVYYISVGSSTCFMCWHPSFGAHTTAITASGID